jgi:hypothetical protein
MATEEEWTCLRKRRYPTRAKARWVARRASLEIGKVRAYRCPFGPHYHIGHPPRVTEQR